MNKEGTEPRESFAETISPVVQSGMALGSFGTVIFFVVLAQVILMIGLNVYQKSRLESIETEILAQQQVLSETANSNINTQITNVISGETKLAQALSSKVRWSNFYIKLNSVTPKNVRITTVSISETGAIKAEGETNSLSSLARAVVAWQSGTATVTSPFNSVSLSSNNLSSGKVLFSITGQINTGAL